MPKRYLLYDLDLLQYVDVPSQNFAALWVITKQARPIGVVERQGKKYLKYLFVNWK